MKEKLNCIMLIDDDDPTNFLSKMLIEEAECTKHLEVMDSGIKALEFLKQATNNENFHKLILPDLVFLDINMPCMNGWEFLEEYQKLEKKKPGDTVIVMLTTSLNPDDEFKAASISAINGFEIKPLTPEIIERVISSYFKPATNITHPG